MVKRTLFLKRLDSTQIKQFCARSVGPFSYYGWRAKNPSTISKWGFDDDGEFYIVSHHAKDYLKIVTTIELKTEVRKVLSNLLETIPNLKLEELRVLLNSLNVAYLETLKSKPRCGESDDESENEKHD